jgi:hypothetical protein
MVSATPSLEMVWLPMALLPLIKYLFSDVLPTNMVLSTVLGLNDAVDIIVFSS